jgi:hypothetical protein
MTDGTTTQYPAPRSSDGRRFAVSVTKRPEPRQGPEKGARK